MQIVASWERQGIAKGRQEGRQEQASSLVLRQLKRKFGKVSKSIEQTIATLPIDRLNDLGEALLDFNFEADLRAWLKQIGG
jgi:predicted transposase YdaD